VRCIFAPTSNRLRRKYWSRNRRGRRWLILRSFLGNNCARACACGLSAPRSRGDRLIQRWLALLILACMPGLTLAQKPAAAAEFRGVYAQINLQPTEEMVARLGVA